MLSEAPCFERLIHVPLKSRRRLRNRNPIALLTSLTASNLIDDRLVILKRGFFGAENLKEMVTVWELPYDPPE